MRSLRNRLFLMIVLPLIVIGIVASLIRHQIATENAQKLYDKTLHAVAKTISRDVVLSEGDVLAEDLLEELTDALGDPIYYRVVGPDGRFVAGYSRIPVPDQPIGPLTNAPSFFDATYYDDPVRAVIFKEFISEPEFGGWVTVQVWQTNSRREAHSLRLAGLSAAFMAVIILAAGAVVWFGINFGLRPLLELREAVTMRSPDDLKPIKRPIPPEVNSLVDAMNRLFGRLSAAFAARDALISNAAHQLRNPIAAIQAQAEAAESAPNEQELRARWRRGRGRTPDKPSDPTALVTRKGEGARIGGPECRDRSRSAFDRCLEALRARCAASWRVHHLRARRRAFQAPRRSHYAG